MEPIRAKTDPKFVGTLVPEGIAVFHSPAAPEVHLTAWFPTWSELFKLALGGPILVQVEGPKDSPNMSVEAGWPKDGTKLRVVNGEQPEGIDDGTVMG